MLSNTFAPASARRRGIVLILVLATLALMAVIGVTFATFTGQGKIGARNFAQSVLAPRPDDLMDFALQQLIADTGDVRSAIRGHSLARDMYGNDAANNGYLASRPDGASKPPGTDPFFYVTGVSQVGTSTQYNLTTNIPVGDPAFYGYNFTRWTLRLTFIGAPHGSRHRGCRPDPRDPRRHLPWRIPGVHRRHGPDRQGNRPLHLDA